MNKWTWGFDSWLQLVCLLLLSLSLSLASSFYVSLRSLWVVVGRLGHLSMLVDLAEKWQLDELSAANRGTSSKMRYEAMEQIESSLWRCEMEAQNGQTDRQTVYLGHTNHRDMEHNASGWSCSVLRLVRLESLIPADVFGLSSNSRHVACLAWFAFRHQSGQRAWQIPLCISHSLSNTQSASGRCRAQ